jgi:uncharacterized protein (TIGR03083 family)
MISGYRRRTSDEQARPTSVRRVTTSDGNPADNGLDHTLDYTALDYIGHIRADGNAMADALDHGPLDAPVAACPGWDVAALATHMGDVHRWAMTAAMTAARPEQGAYETEPPEGVSLSAWLRDGTEALAAALEQLDPTAPTWHIFPAPRVVGVWRRRQAHELAIHRWDAETAVGLPARLDPELSSDGIDEYLGTVLQRLVMRKGLVLPAGSLHVHCTDVAGEWLIRAGDGEVLIERAHAKGDVAFRGPAETLVLHFWGRRGGDIETLGDQALAAEWLALGGL